MNKQEKQSFGVKLLLTLGKIVLFILVFPYQIVINRKESRYSVRSLLAYILVEKNEGEDKKKKSFRYTLSFPGLCIKDLKKKSGPKAKACTSAEPAEDLDDVE